MISRRIALVAALLVAAFVSALSPLGADYGNLGCHLNAPRCDEPAWPLESLARGRFAEFVHEQPLMGPASLILRAPFAAGSRLFHADLTWHYRAGLLPCLVLLALLALALARRSRAGGNGRLYAAVVVVLAFANPLVLSAIRAGHPEELVAAAAVVGAGLLVLDGRWTLAVADTHRFVAVVQAAGSLGSRYGEATAPDAWYFSARSGDFVWPTGIQDGQLVYADAPGYRVSDTAAHESLFVLMAAILFLRCVLDPGDHLYYHVAAATALVAYEALRPRARFPWLAASFVAGLWLVTRIDGHVHTDTGSAWVYIGFAVPTLAGLALIACRRSRSTPPTKPSQISRKPVMGLLPA